MKKPKPVIKALIAKMEKYKQDASDDLMKGVSLIILSSGEVDKIISELKKAAGE